MQKMGVESRIYSFNYNPRPALLSDIFVAHFLASKAVRAGFDVLIFHQGQAASALVRRAKSICYFHQIKYDDLTANGIAYSTYKNFLTAIERRLTHIVCNSEFAASRIKAIL